MTPHFALSGNSMKNLPKAGPGYSPMQNLLLLSKIGCNSL
nr:MAG TPA: hypothetical protein [Crassvirales sp.]